MRLWVLSEIISVLTLHWLHCALLVEFYFIRFFRFAYILFASGHYCWSRARRAYHFHSHRLNIVSIFLSCSLASFHSCWNLIRRLLLIHVSISNLFSYAQSARLKFPIIFWKVFIFIVRLPRLSRLDMTLKCRSNAFWFFCTLMDVSIDKLLPVNLDRQTVCVSFWNILAGEMVSMK